MKANLYYTSDKTADYKYTTISGATSTATVWTPASGKRIVLTGLLISSNLGDLVTIKEGTTTGAPDTVFAVHVGSSSYVNVDIGPIELSAVDNVLYANADAPGTSGVHIVAAGFES